METLSSPYFSAYAALRWAMGFDLRNLGSQVFCGTNRRQDAGSQAVMQCKGGSRYRLSRHRRSTAILPKADVYKSEGFTPGYRMLPFQG